MTGPTPDPSGNIAPGLYHAEGDPPGTVRQWDGTQWVGGPVPAPPGSAGGMAAPPGNFADMGVRFGAMAIDAIVFAVVSVVLTLPFLEDTSTTDNSFEFQVTGFGSIVGPLAVIALWIVMVTVWGGSPGKLMLGLRITTANGTTPPGFGPAAIRALVWVPTLIPLLGIVAWLGIVIASIIFISNDHERRSVFDRAANTRVIRK